ncbi:tyrosine-type recombinase/integrase [Desulforhopalus singaporensis]|uniref:Site-specific recombinase XerD n=1 Tax=Desulforhopalus singaporensis TaxID=91360 RepID=A0A1H0VK62_9BACT|nr:site-specific integrase [Desulforhopalus singaporensis]SDP78724.1 Site-specific recombinase XerD [Desulforhopalus singaporensis]
MKVKDIRLDEAWKHFVEIKLPEEKGGKNEKLRWEKHIEPYFNDCYLSEITTFKIDVFSRNLKNKKLSPQSVKHVLSLLRRTMRQMSKWELYSGPIPIFNMPRFDNEATRFLTPEEARILIEELYQSSSSWLGDFATLALNTGCRAGELFKLNKGCVDKNEKLLHIKDTKNSKNRFVPLNKTAYEVVEAYMQEDAYYFFLKGVGPQKNQIPPIFRRTVSHLGFNSGITDSRHRVVFHTLRHTCASWMVQKGVSLVVVSKILGHSSLKITMRYAHLAPEQSLAAVKAVEDRFQETTPSKKHKC